MPTTKCICAELGATGSHQRHTSCRAHDARELAAEQYADAQRVAERVLSDVADDDVLDAARAAVSAGTHAWQYDDEHDDVIGLKQLDSVKIAAVLVYPKLADFELDELWLQRMTDAKKG